MSKDKQREAFEAWYESFSLPAESDWFRREKDDAEEYFYANTHFAWKAWQAAQQAKIDSYWDPSEKDYDRSIHQNPDAEAWADFFVETFPAMSDKHDVMLGWFANAMMAMHDHIHAKQQAQWLPIESAPRDETPILAYAKSVFGVVDISEMFFVDGDWYWFRDGEVPDAQPTHWMPLPPEPKR